MGTTDQGYSVYIQVIHGGRISLLVALVATLIAMTIAIVSASSPRTRAASSTT